MQAANRPPQAAVFRTLLTESLTNEPWLKNTLNRAPLASSMPGRAASTPHIGPSDPPKFTSLMGQSVPETGRIRKTIHLIQPQSGTPKIARRIWGIPGGKGPEIHLQRNPTCQEEAPVSGGNRMFWGCRESPERLCGCGISLRRTRLPKFPV